MSARRAPPTAPVQQGVEIVKDVQGREVLTAHAPILPLRWLMFVELPIDEAYAPLYESIKRSSYLLLGGLTLAFLAGLFLARKMIIPIQRLRLGAAQIGAGNLEQRISIKTGDELEALADQFNDMAGRLEESYAGLEQKVEQRTHELSESLAQQTATSEVLQVISSSPGELEPVFNAMLDNAVRICEAKFGQMFLVEAGRVRMIAHLGVPPALHEHEKERGTFEAAPESPLGILIRTKQASHTTDISAIGAELPIVKARRGARACRSADAQRRRAGRRHHHLPPGGSDLHRQANRAGDQLRQPGRDRHRERPPAQRIARAPTIWRARSASCRRWATSPRRSTRPSISKQC